MAFVGRRRLVVLLASGAGGLSVLADVGAADSASPFEVARLPEVDRRRGRRLRLLGFGASDGEVSSLEAVAESSSSSADTEATASLS